MSSVGQVAGGIIGGAIGFMAGGNVMLGVSIGASIGGYIDPPPGQNTVGPRLEDLTVQTSTYGAVLPRIKGTVAVTGNVFWLEGDKLKEITNTKKVGGKGGPTAKQTTFSYTATFAVGLSHQIAAPIAGIRRLWLANMLVYDAGSDDLNSVIASNTQQGIVFKLYDGRDDQQPDPRMQADKGSANVSGYPGRAYIVFYDLDLTEKYNNTLMATQVKAEIVMGSAATEYDLLMAVPDGIGGSPTDNFRTLSLHVASPQEFTVGTLTVDGWAGGALAAEFVTIEPGVKQSRAVYSLAGINPAVYLPGRLQQTDTPCVVLLEAIGYPVVTGVRLHYIYPSSVVVTPTITTAGYLNYAMAIDGTDTFLCSSDGVASPVLKISGGSHVASSAANYDAGAIGVSESYVFCVQEVPSGGSTTTVYQFNRADLSLVATHTGAAPHPASIQVVSDTEFYTLNANSHVYLWEGGEITRDLGVALKRTNAELVSTYTYFFHVFTSSPFFGVSIEAFSPTDAYIYIGHDVIAAQAAKLRDIVTEECALAGISSGDLDLTELVNSDVRGYRVSQAGSVRSVLEQLQAAFPFDVIQSGYKLRFKSRGGASVLTVPESDLGAHTGNDIPSRFMLTTEMPSQVPAKVTFNFLNADREYDPDEQSAAFTAQDVKDSYTVSLPLVMTPTEALQAADVLLKKEQRERTTAGTFWLPPADDYRKLEAADVIDVIAQGRTHTLRLTKVTQLPDGRVECDGKLTSSAAYASAAQAQPSLATGQTLVPLAGSSELLLLDIPRIVSDQDVPGISLGMYGFTDGWPGGVALRSDDSGETYNSIVAFSAKTEAFTASNALAAHNGYALDASSILTVTPDWTGADLFSITESQLYANGNIAAYGAEGRWEIVCFKTATASGSDYVIRDFLRGLFGTEWATGLHVAGDRLVMLDLTTTDFAGLPLTAINSPRLWRGVTAGAALDSAVDVSNTYGAVNLMPLSPVDGYGTIDRTTGDWLIGVQRRTRWQVSLFSGAEVPLGESAASYVFDVWDATYTTLKRTVASAVAYFTYSAAQQTADFGGVTTTVYVKAYQVSSVVGRGFPLQFSLTRYFADDPFIASVVSLAHFDGPSFVDETGKSITAVGGAQISTSRFKYGGASLLLSGSGQYCSWTSSADWNFGTGDFADEAWIFIAANSSPAADGNRYAMISSVTDGAGSILYEFSVTGDASTTGTGLCIYSTSGGLKSVSGTISHGVWHHVAACRASGSLRFFLDGTQMGSTIAAATSYGSSSLPRYVGGRPFGSNYYYYLNGNIDDSRVTKAARYTANFTPPVSAHPNP